jgi:hypothetical protein
VAVVAWVGVAVGVTEMRWPTLFVCVAGSALGSAALAEDRIALQTYKYTEATDRMVVRATNVDVDKDFGVNWSAQFHLGVDAISGATPCWKPKAGYANEYASGLCQVGAETRQSVSASVLRRDASRHEYRLGFAHSAETDFVSRELSAQAQIWHDEAHNRAYTVAASLQDNTSVATGNTNNTANLGSRAYSLQWGVNQVLDRSSTLQANVHVGRDVGYLSNHYLKIVRDDGAGQHVLALDARPALRQNAGVSVRWIKAWGEPFKTNLWYRHDRDSWWVASHTLEAKAYWDINAQWRLNPVLRWFTQTSANFYRGYGDAVNTFAASGPGSNDARLGALHSTTAQLHAQYQADKNWSLNLGVSAYRQSTGLHATWATAGFVFKY